MTLDNETRVITTEPEKPRDEEEKKSTETEVVRPEIDREKLLKIIAAVKSVKQELTAVKPVTVEPSGSIKPEKIDLDTWDGVMKLQPRPLEKGRSAAYPDQPIPREVPYILAGVCNSCQREGLLIRNADLSLNADTKKIVVSFKVDIPRDKEPQWRASEVVARKAGWHREVGLPQAKIFGTLIFETEFNMADATPFQLKTYVEGGVNAVLLGIRQALVRLRDRQRS